MTDTDFQINEFLTWENRAHPNAPLTRRMVAFRGYQNNQAIVAFGLKSDFTGQENLFSVPPSELSRPVGYGIRPDYGTRPQISAPTVPLEERRQSLREAFSNYSDAQNAVHEAQTLLDRALERMEKSQRELRNYRDMEEHAVSAVLHEIRLNGNGHSIADDDAKWQERESALRQCNAAEQAYHTLAAELAQARTVSSDRQMTLERAASFVLAGIIEREVDALALWETEIAELRARLRAAQLLWLGGTPIPIAPIQAKVLNEPPAEIVEGIGQRMANTELRQQMYSELFARLCAGEIDADL